MRVLDQLTLGGVAPPQAESGAGQGRGAEGEPALLQTHFLRQLDSRRQSRTTKGQQDKRIHNS